MKSTDILKDAVANTSRSKMRTGLTVMAIFVGAFTLTLTNSIGTGISSYIDNQLGSLGAENMMTVHTKVEETSGNGPMKYEPASGDEAAMQQRAAQMGFSMTALKKEDIDKIEKLDHVKEAEPVIMARPDYITGINNEKYVVSINPAATIMTPDIKVGTGFTGTEDNYEAIIPPSYVTALGYSDAQAISGKEVTFGVTDAAFKQHEVKAKVVGVQNKSLFGETVALNKPLTKELVKLSKIGQPNPEEAYMSALIIMDDNGDEQTVKDLKAELDSLGYEGETIKDQIGIVQSVISGVVGILNAFAIITLIAASFGIMNTLLMSVKERTREIGLMKAMGMSSRKIFALFSTEAVFIGFLGSAIGAGVAMLTGTALSAVASQTVLSSLEGLTISLFTVSDVATVIGVVMLIAFLSGTIPAARAAKQNPIDALHYE